jgi:hypothetical protein
MSSPSAHEYDVFISYARIDNRTAEGEPEKNGWVTRFHRHLSITLAKKSGDDVRIWRDARQISGNQLFDKAIQDAVERSAVFVALLSPGYVRSTYCRQELEAFFKKAQHEPVGLALGDEYRIFNVLLSNIPHNAWPHEFGRAGGFKFHDADEGDDVEGDAVEVEGERFKDQLRALARAIHKTLTRLKHGDPSPDVTPEEEPGRARIYVAATSDSLDIVRKRIAGELADSKSVQIITKVPPPHDVSAHDEAVRSRVESADLSVHLLGATPGQELFDCDGAFYPQRQAELALAHGKSQLMLIPQGIVTEAIEDAAYRSFVDRLENGPRGSQATYCVQRGLPSEMTRQILDHVAQLRARSEATTRGFTDATLLDTHVKDQLHAFELKEYLNERHVQTLINPLEDDPGKNSDEFIDRLRRVGLLIIFYGSVPLEWVRARLHNALQIAVEKSFPLRACGVYMAPPLTPQTMQTFTLPLVSLEWMDHTRGFNASAVDHLLARVRAASGGQP